MKSDTAIVFTDGSSRGNPGPGGWGAVIIFPGADSMRTVEEYGGREDMTTNNRMELTASIRALSAVLSRGAQRAILHTDSRYVINGITKWVHGWMKNGWMTATKEEVQNRDLWEPLFDTAERLSVDWRYVEGHAGTAGNERCDEIATSFADNVALTLYTGTLSQYPVRDILSLASSGKKSSSKSRSKAAAYSYASFVNGEFRTHKTWAQCEAHVKGKAGAKFKKTFSEEDEEALRREWTKR